MSERTGIRLFIAVALALTLARIVTLIGADFGLGPDEAQYWYWSQTPDTGYYSKPPLIAWAIAASTAIFGDAEWAVRLPAPLFHLGSALFLFAAIRPYADGRIAALAGLLWITLPGVFLSSSLMTTDAPLLFFWTAALFFLLRFIAQARLGDAAATGAAIGLGLLSKYAMIYFPIGLAAAALFDPSTRKKLATPRAALAIAAPALIVFAPNLAWNAAHEFQTIAHTADNANWAERGAGPGHFLNFLVGQVGIIGPTLIVCGALAMRFFWRLRELRLLAILTATPLLIIAAQALISRAHANWAATAYPSLIMMIALWAGANLARQRVLYATLALHLAIGAGFMATFISRDYATAIGAAPAYKSLSGWRAHGADVARAAAAANVDAIIVEDRELIAELHYYARGETPIFAIDSNHRIDNHFEAFNRFAPHAGARVLFVSRTGTPAALGDGFLAAEQAGQSVATTKPGGVRALYFYVAEAR
jgi:4-amino-4-deoxy-L-arabinose transferase-like glycosyltransferase